MNATMELGPLRVVIDGTCSAANPVIVQDCVTPETGEKWVFEVGSTNVCFLETSAARNSDEMPGTYAEKPHRFRKSPEHDESMAYARLFAAAPDLLEACRMGHSDSHGLPSGDLLAAANVLRNSGHDDLADGLERKHAAAQAAIAKATGEQP